MHAQSLFRYIYTVLVWVTAGSEDPAAFRSGGWAGPGRGAVRPTVKGSVCGVFEAQKGTSVLE